LQFNEFGHCLVSRFVGRLGELYHTPTSLYQQWPQLLLHRYGLGCKERDNPGAVVEKATDLFECRPERYAAEKDSGGIFLDPVQRAAFPLGLVPTSGAKAGGKMARATLGWEFSLRAE
jgi:hypothetical protein